MTRSCFASRDRDGVSQGEEYDRAGSFILLAGAFFPAIREEASSEAVPCH